MRPFAVVGEPDVPPKRDGPPATARSTPGRWRSRYRGGPTRPCLRGRMPPGPGGESLPRSLGKARGRIECPAWLRTVRTDHPNVSIPCGVDRPDRLDGDHAMAP